MNGLEALKVIRPCANVCGDYDPYCDIIEKELKDGEKYKEALEIIDKKNVNVGMLKRSESVGSYHYKMDELRDKCKPLTQHEFDLLKEVMKC